MINKDKPIRIGKIDYSNVWPIFYLFPIEEFHGQVEIVQQYPTELNQGMATGKIDLGPISSFGYAEFHKQYYLLPDLSVSAFGKVNSVLLFYKKPFERILNGRVALTKTSATSVNLLKIILQKFYGGSPQYHYSEPSLHDMMLDSDAALLIGDEAIKSRMSNHDYGVLDLSEEWNKQTGQWMTFAVWAINEETTRNEPELTRRIYDAFIHSKKQFLRNREPLIRTARDQIGGSIEFWDMYFAELCYDFGVEQQRGLQLYYQYAFELGLLRHEVALRVWPSNETVKVEE